MKVCEDSPVSLFLRKKEWPVLHALYGLLLLFLFLFFAVVRQWMINQKLIFSAISKNKSLWQTKYGLNEAYGWFVLIRYKVNVPAIVTFIKVRTCGCSSFSRIALLKNHLKIFSVCCRWDNMAWQYIGNLISSPHLSCRNCSLYAKLSDRLSI